MGNQNVKIIAIMAISIIKKVKDMLENLSAFSKLIIIIGGLITIFGGYLASIKSEKGNKKAEEAISENSKLTKKVADLSRENLEFAKSLKILSDRNIALSEENANLLKSSLEQITGGESYPYIRARTWYFDGKPNDQFEILLLCNGKIPIYDLSVEINEVNIFNNKENIHDFSRTPVYKRKIGTFKQSIDDEILLNINLSSKEKIYFEIKYKARNGDFTQDLALVKIGNRWANRTRIRKYIYDESNNGFEILLLKEENSPDFPVGSIIWTDEF